MRRNSNGGAAHMLACGCRPCRDRMQLDFARILAASYDPDELAALSRPPHVGDTDLSTRIRERIAAYSGPLPDLSA